jgi:hypothetical protein
LIRARKIDARDVGASRVGAAASEAEEAGGFGNTSSINHKIYGERFVKPRVLACLLSSS